MIHKTSPTKNRAARTRSPVEYEDDEPSRKGSRHGHAPRRLSLSRPEVWLSSFAPATVRPWLLSTPVLPTLALGYCLLSVLVLSGYLGSTRWSDSHKNPASLDASVLEGLPLEHLLAKVSSLRPLPSVSPNILSVPQEKPVFSAALWTSEAEVEQIETWAAEWRGPFSLLVTTTAAPSSTQHADLVAKLTAIQRKHPPLKKTFFVHLLHLDLATDTHPNAFLNIARLLAPSPRVVLFPGNLSSVPPKTLYNNLLHQQPTSSAAMNSAGRPRKRKSSVVTDRERTSFPFIPLAPVVLSRDDATWCSERFFANTSRAADWEECLWQVWLANFGNIDVRQVPGLAMGGADTMEYAATAKLHRRLVSKFRSETCGLAVRRFAALRDPNSGADTKKARWLKRICRGWTSN